MWRLGCEPRGSVGSSAGEHREPSHSGHRVSRTAASRAAAGQPAVVLIEGEAGIGKTRLLAEALADARGRGMQVAAGRAEELEGMRPFGLMTGVFGCTRSATDPRRAAIGELLSGGTGERNPITVTSDPGLRFRSWTRSPTWWRSSRWPGRW